MLRILLAGESEYMASLTFTGKDTDVDVSSDDIYVCNYAANYGLPDIKKAALLETGDGSFDIETNSFTVFADIPQEIEVSAEPTAIDLDSDGSAPKGKVTYTVSIQKPFILDGEKEYTFTIKLPESLSLPEGELTFSAVEGGLDSISCGETVVGTLELGNENSPTLQGSSLTADDNGFTFTVNAPGKLFAEGETYVLYLTLYAAIWSGPPRLSAARSPSLSARRRTRARSRPPILPPSLSPPGRTSPARRAGP